jgi:hypothetical protein
MEKKLYLRLEYTHLKNSYFFLSYVVAFGENDMFDGV